MSDESGSFADASNYDASDQGENQFSSEKAADQGTNWGYYPSSDKDKSLELKQGQNEYTRDFSFFDYDRNFSTEGITDQPPQACQTPNYDYDPSPQYAPQDCVAPSYDYDPSPQYAPQDCVAPSYDYDPSPQYAPQDCVAPSYDYDSSPQYAPQDCVAPSYDYDSSPQYASQDFVAPSYDFADRCEYLADAKHEQIYSDREQETSWSIASKRHSKGKSQYQIKKEPSLCECCWLKSCNLW